MTKTNYPMTRGVRTLQAKKITYTPHLYPYEDHGGTHHAATSLAVDEHKVIKTLVLEPDNGKPFLVLMHGDCEVSTKQLARQINAKSVTPCTTEKAQRVTGYQVGGISPFGTRQPLTVYVEHTILELDCIYINGGKRGFLVEIAPAELRSAFNIQKVEVAINT